MIFRWVLGFAAMGPLLVGQSVWSTEQRSNQRAAANSAAIPISFEPNRGQFKTLAGFTARTPAYQVLITSNRLRLVPLQRASPASSMSMHRISGKPTNAGLIDINLPGANSAAAVIGEQRQEWVTNYLYGDSRGTYRNVPNYASVRIIEAYPGIDWDIRAAENEIEHDFIVQPHADYQKIAIRFSGAHHLHLEPDGAIKLSFANGAFLQRPPIAYQLDQAGHKHIVPARYTLKSGVAHFVVSDHDPSRTLVIDPALAYSTYLGGSHGDSSRRIAVDSAGNAYIAGLSNSVDFPTVGQQLPASNPTSDLFIAKLNPSGSALVYSTYLGGTGVATLAGMAIDAAGAVYLGGDVTGGDFPTVNALQSVYKPSNTIGTQQGFIAKVDPSGGQLVYSTYLGGSAALNSLAALTVDPSGNVYVAGWTSSTDFPIVNALQTTNRGRINAYVAKLAADGQQLLYSTYLGGTAADLATGIAIDGAQNIIVVGQTNSLDFPLAAPLQVQNNVAIDGSTNFTTFITKIDSSGSSLVFSTYLGGSVADLARAVVVDTQGNIYVTGQTESPDFPVKDAIQPNNKAVNQGGNVFVSKLDALGASLIYSTFLGGSGGGNGLVGDNPNAIAIDSSDNVYIAGSTSSTDFPIADAVQTKNNSTLGATNAFVSEISASGSSLVFSTYLGGSTSYGNAVTHTNIPFGDIAWGLAVSATNDIYVTGETGSADFPIINAYQSTNKTTTQYGSNPTGFVTKFGTQVAPPGSTPSRSPHGGGGVFRPMEIIWLLVLCCFGARARARAPTTLLDLRPFFEPFMRKKLAVDESCK